MPSTMFKSAASSNGKSAKSGLLKAMQDRQYLTAYRWQSLEISLDSYRSASFVQFGKASQLCKFKKRAELRHLRRAQSSSFVKRAFWMIQELATKLLSKDVQNCSPVSTVSGWWLICNWC